MYRTVAVMCLWAGFSLSLMSGCDIARAGYQGAQDQQTFQKEVVAAGLVSPAAPEGASTQEIIAYVAGSIGVLLSGLFLGKKYMPNKP